MVFMTQNLFDLLIGGAQTIQKFFQSGPPGGETWVLGDLHGGKKCRSISVQANNKCRLVLKFCVQ